jgi:hypothetical protein
MKKLIVIAILSIGFLWTTKVIGYELEHNIVYQSEVMCPQCGGTFVRFIRYELNLYGSWSIYQCYNCHMYFQVRN